MAAVSSTKTGLWSDPTVWSNAAIPTTADDMTVLNTHTVTFDATTNVCRSLTVNSGGKVAAQTSASSKITAQFGIHILSGGTYEALLTASAAITHQCRLYAAAAGAASGDDELTCDVGSTLNLQGYNRKPWTRLTASKAAGQSSFAVDDATGWQVGDRLIFNNTRNLFLGTRDTEEVIITGLTFLSGGVGPATITGFTNQSAGTTLLFAHLVGLPIANFTKNIVVGPQTPNVGGCIRAPYGTSVVTRIIKDVLIDQNNDSVAGSRGLQMMTLTSAAVAGSVIDIERTAFYRCNWGMGYWFLDAFATETSTVVLDDLVHWAVSGSQQSNFTLWPAQVVNRWLLMQADINANSNAFGPNTSINGAIFNGCSFASFQTWFVRDFGVTYNSCDWWAAQYSMFCTNSGQSATYNNCRWGGMYGVDSNIQSAFYRSGNFGDVFTFNGCTFNGAALPDGNGWETGTVCGEQGRVIWRTGNSQPASNEVLAMGGNILSDSVTQRNSPLAAKFQNRINASGSVTYLNQKFTLTVAPNTPTTILFSARIDSNFTGTNYPKVTATMGSTVLGTWQAVNTPNVWQDGSLTFSHSQPTSQQIVIEMRGESINKTTSNFWFSGLPFDPCVSAARWYGYVFNEASQVATLDPYKVDSEATAIAYTGAAFNYGTKRVTFTGGTIGTSFQKLYDWGQAYGVSAASFSGTGYSLMPWTRAGTALLLATGWTVVDPSVTGMTWSGGTIEMNTNGTKTGSFSSTTLNLKATGTYDVTGCTFGGTINLANGSAGSIDIFVPAGFVPGTVGSGITIHTPTVLQQAITTGWVPNSKVRIYDKTNSVELQIGLADGSGNFSWSDGSTATGPRLINVRGVYYVGTAGRLFVDTDIGTCGVTSTDCVKTYNANQTTDDVYAANGVDGTTVTGITFTATGGTDRVFINLSTGSSRSAQEIYAAQCAWLYTDTGIRDDGAIMVATDQAHYRCKGFKLKNTNAWPNYIKITGGWLKDFTTGLFEDIVDFTGGGIFPPGDQVIGFTTGSGPLTLGQQNQLAAAAAAAANMNFRTPIGSTSTALEVTLVAVKDHAVAGTGSGPYV